MPGFGAGQFRHMLRELTDSYGLCAAQLVEAASYSMAMVVRYALGLSSEGGRVGVLASDCLAGWTALATLRHLTNAGASGFVALFERGAQRSPDLVQQLKPLQRCGVEVIAIPPKIALDDPFSCKIAECHNTLCGLFELDYQIDRQRPDLMEVLNELSTPIHSIVCPPGVDPDSGEAGSSVIYASSTLSLGVPLQGLVKAADFAGRHYLCDLSVAPALYADLGFDLSLLFSEQPVVQIFAANEQAQ